MPVFARSTSSSQSLIAGSWPGVQCPSGRISTRRLQGCGPPQQIVDHRPGRCPQLGQSSLDIAALVVSPQGGDRDVDRCANRGDLNLDHRLAKLLDAACAHCGAITHEASGLAIPLRINPVDGVLEHRWGSVVVFRRDEDEPVGLRDLGGPSLNDLVLESRATRRGRRYWLIEERHRIFAQIEQPRIDTIALLQVLQYPLRRLLRETAFPSATHDY